MKIKKFSDDILLKDYLLNKKFRKYFSISLLACSYLLFILWLVLIFSTGGNNWGTGEWLINYNGGFIRRGMIGNLIFALTPLDSMILPTLFILQASVAGLLFFFYQKALSSYGYSWSAIALICNPFGLCLIGWDRFVFARKELLGILCLAILSIGILKRMNNTGTLTLITLGLFSVAVFSSEVNLVFLPAIIYLLFNLYRNQISYKFIFVCVVFCLIDLLAFLSSFYFRGDDKKVKAICDQITSKGLDSNLNCKGAVYMMGQPASEFFKLLRDAYPSYLIYIPLIILAFIPIISNKWIKENWVWASAIILSQGSLFFMALDYGRNIFIIVNTLTICIVSTRSEFSVKLHPNLVLGYILFLGMGHTGNPLTNGWIGAIPTATRSLLRFFL